MGSMLTVLVTLHMIMYSMLARAMISPLIPVNGFAVTAGMLMMTEGVVGDPERDPGWHM